MASKHQRKEKRRREPAKELPTGQTSDLGILFQDPLLEDHHKLERQVQLQVEYHRLSALGGSRKFLEVGEDPTRTRPSNQWRANQALNYHQRVRMLARE